MTKKRLLLGVILLVFALIGDFCIWRYPVSSDNARLTVTVPIRSAREGDVTVYWLTGEQNPDIDFAQTQAYAAHYLPSEEVQYLELELPANATWLRVDPTAEEAEIAMGEPRLRVRSVSCGNPLSFEDVSRDHGIASMTEAFAGSGSDAEDAAEAEGSGSNDGTSASVPGTSSEDRIMTIHPSGDDPYLIWQTDRAAIDVAAAKAYRPMYVAIKLALIAALTVILLIVWLKWTAISDIPKEIVANRQLIANLAKNDFKTRFAGSILGIVWAFVQPIVTVVIYWFVFQKALNAGTASTKAGITVPFVLWLVAGLVPWFYFQELMISGTNALIEYNYLVKKVVFNISILPVVKAVSALFVHLFFVGFMLVLYACYGHFPDLYMLQIIYYSFSMMILGLGIIYFTSAVVVFFRDLAQIVNIGVQVLVWATPIMWNIDGMTNIPRAVEVILKLNPMYYVVSGYRDALINQGWFWNRAGLTLWFWLVTGAIFIAGTMIFRKLRVHFADVL